MAAGAFTLVIASVFATKANKKFTTPATIYYGPSSADILVTGCTSTSILTETGSSNTLYLSSKTSSSTFYTIYYTPNLGTSFNKVHVNL